MTATATATSQANASEVVRVRALVEALLMADPDVADRDAVAAIVARSRELRSWLDAVDVRCSRRSRLLAAQGRSEPAESMLGDGGRRSGREAAAVKARDEVCDAMPGFEEALASGAVAGGHIDAIANASRNLTGDLRERLRKCEHELLAAAETERVEMFERTVRDLIRSLAATHDAGSDIDELQGQRAASRLKRWVDKTAGMCHTHVELDPVRDELEVEALIAAVTAGVIRSPANNDTGTDNGETAGGGWVPVAEAPVELRVPEVGILVDWHSLMEGAHRYGICETYHGVPVPVSMVRRLCCDAEIYPLVMNGEGEVVDQGRSKRTINWAQRRRLRAMHRSCGERDCQVPFEQCRIHHVRFWTRDHGASDIDNLLPLCDRHHHLVHEGGWTLTMTAERVATWVRPDGSIHHVGSTIDRAPHGVTPPDIDRPDVNPAGQRPTPPGQQPSTGPPASGGVTKRRPGDRSARRQAASRRVPA